MRRNLAVGMFWSIFSFFATLQFIVSVGKLVSHYWTGHILLTVEKFLSKWDSANLQFPLMLGHCNLVNLLIMTGKCSR